MRAWQGADVHDGQWHMLTVTTHLDASPGYSLFLDGGLAGDLSSSSRDPHGNPVQVALHAPQPPCLPHPHQRLSSSLCYDLLSVSTVAAMNLRWRQRPRPASHR